MNPNTNGPEQVLPPQQPTKKSHKAVWIILAIGFIITVITVIAVASAMGGAVNNAIKQGDSVTATHVPFTEPGIQRDPTPNKGNYTLTDKDVVLSLTTVSKQCYGYGVGCNLDYKVKASWTPGLVGEDTSWSVHYTVTGSEDGPVIGTLTLNGDGTYLADENMVTTKSKNTVLKIKVTSIERDGLPDGTY